MIRRVSHLYWRRIYFGGVGVVEVCGMFILDWGMYDVLVLNGDRPSPILSDTSNRMCPLFVLSLDFTRGRPSWFLSCLSCPCVLKCSLRVGWNWAGTLVLNFTAWGNFLAFCFRREMAWREKMCI